MTCWRRLFRSVPRSQEADVAPAWVTVLSWGGALALAGIRPLITVFDIYARGYRQRMRVMEALGPVTGLYFGPVAVWLIRRGGVKEAM